MREGLLILSFICLGVAQPNLVAYLYSRNGTIKVKYLDHPPKLWMAKAIFTDSIQTSGWSYLEVESNPEHDDATQVYAAGFIEGYLTSHYIQAHWRNTQKDFCKDIPKTCQKIGEFFKKNLVYVEEMIGKHGKHASYWHHVNLYYTQLKGISDGNIATHEKGDKSLDYHDILVMNMMWDVSTLLDVFSPKSEMKAVELQKIDRCSALIKITPDLQELIVGHATWEKYNSMLRIMKKYSFHLHISPNSNIEIPGRVMVFSSYPGAIISGDDFNLISSGLVTTETTNGLYSDKMWKYIKPRETVMEAVRSLVANRLASNPREWRDHFVRWNSGTYNNQWMVVDYKAFKKGARVTHDLVWIVEQVPALEFSTDITFHLYEKGYWASYNIPYFEYVYNSSGYAAKAAEFGEWYTYDKSPRARMFHRDQNKVGSERAALQLLRYNSYKEDPLSQCKTCSPIQNACNAIAARCDLNPINGSYPFYSVSHRMHGATDAKVTSSALIANMQILAVSGPSFGPGVPVFDWDKILEEDQLTHDLHPSKFKFSDEIHEWVF